jgi:signal transduction histidine kinase
MRIIHAEDERERAKFPEALLQGLNSLNAVLLIPLIHQNELIGLLTLGKKKSDEEFTQEELSFLPTLAGQVATALSNASLYDEAVKRRKEAEEAKEEALAAKKKTEEMELELIQRERNKILGEMTGGVAHEMRHPLQYTVGSAYFIKKAIPDLNALSTDSAIPADQRKRIAKVSETVTQYLEKIKSAAGRINSIVLTLETFAKRNQSHAQTLTSEEKPPFQPIDFKFLMSLVLEEMRFRYQSTNRFLAAVETDVQRDLPALNGEQNELIQVFTNLLSNAHDAMEKSPEKKIMIKAYTDPGDGKFVHLEFRDTGQGIPSALRDKVWERGFTTKEKLGGSGLGLFWCKNLIEVIHNGKIWFESADGAGTTFHLKIPAWAEESKAPS